MSTAVEQFSEPFAFHGEGPVWDDGLRFVDMLAGDIVSLDPDGGCASGCTSARWRRRFARAATVASSSRVERGFALVDSDGAIETLPELWTDERVRMNDGATDPEGRFYCGSMAYDATPGAGRLYRLDPDGTVEVVLEPVTISNGLGWSPDGQTAYYVDSPTYRIDAFDADLDQAAARRAQSRGAGNARRADGRPRGRRLGRALGRLRRPPLRARRRRSTRCSSCPSRKVTACTFGGPALDELYITTSRQDGDQPAAGSVFRARPGVSGLPVVPFNG